MTAAAPYLLLLGAYFLGSVPFGLVLGRLRGVDIRQHGSGNIGATNLSRAAGRRWGVLAFSLDFLKGMLPPVLALLGRASAPFPAWLPTAAGAAAILGHVFPIYLRFRGGKGVATAFGAMTALCWQAALAAGVCWFVLYLATRTVSIASLVAAAALPCGVAFWRAAIEREAYPAVQVFAILLAVLIVVRHRGNIARLLRGEELRFKKSPPKTTEP